MEFIKYHNSRNVNIKYISKNSVKFEFPFQNLKKYGKNYENKEYEVFM